MRLLTLLLPLASCVIQATGAAVDTNRALSASNVLKSLTENPNLLPENSRRIIAAKTQSLTRRDQAKESPLKLDDNSIAILGSAFSYITQFGKNQPKTNVPTVQDRSSTTWPGAKRRKIRYGPFRIPPTSEETLESKLLNIKGMINTFSFNAKKPCDDDCVVLGLETSIEYADGKTAEVGSGAWLHHAVLLNLGPDVIDPVCGGSIEHLFESGNERTGVEFGLHNGTIKSGYHVRTGDTFMINTELMNMEDKEKWVWLQLTYDYIEGFPKEYKDGRIIWMSIGPPRCGGKNANPFGPSNLTATARPTKTSFSEYSIPWKARRDGYILGSNSHMHDGGTKTEIFKNDELICSSSPHYSSSVVGGMSGMGGHKRAIKRQDTSPHPSLHIDSQAGCEYSRAAIPLKKGDAMYLRVDYDFAKYAGMKDKTGELDEVMGMSGSLVVFDFP